MLETFIDAFEISENWGMAAQTRTFPSKKQRLQRSSFEMKWHVCFFKHFTEGL